MEDFRSSKKNVMVLLDGTRVEFYGPLNDKIKVEAWRGVLIKEEILEYKKAHALAKQGLKAGGKWE